MRIIPKKTKVSTEFFRGVSLADVLVGFFAVLVLFFVFLSPLPHRLWIDLGLLFFFGFLLARIDEEPNYMFLIRILRHLSYIKGYQKLDPAQAPAPAKKKKKKKARKAPKGGVHLKADAAPQTEAEAPEQTEAEAPEQAAPEDSEPPEQSVEKILEEGPGPEVAEPPEPIRRPTRKERRAAQKAREREAKQRKKARKAEDKFLKSKKVPEEEKAPIRERRKKEAEEHYYAAKVAEQKRKRVDMQKLYLVSEILDGFICYSGLYYGAVLEIPPVEFRFFSPNRQYNAIDRALGSVIRAVGAKYSANLVKLERPMVLDDYIRAEYDKVEALKRSYERGIFSEAEVQARIEVIYDRINALQDKNMEDKVLVPHFYLVLFDSDKRQLTNQVRTALSTLGQGEMAPHRLDDKELAVFLRYVNGLDFDEREIDDIDSADYALFAMPESVEMKSHTTEVNGIITHTFRVSSYPLTVGDAWGASLFDMPGTKVVMKFSQMDREKSIRAIDRSISELNSQLDKTGVSSRVLELQTHIETLSELLVMLQNNNECLMSMNTYVTGYDIAATREDKMLVPQPPPSALPHITGLKKDIKRTFQEQGFKLNDLSFQQFEGFVASQVNGYDPFLKKARGVPGSTVAAVFPWIYASLSDAQGLNLGSTDGVPTFLDFFRRDNERVNSNMVIVGKSGGGKSFATKSILSNLAADDSKIFVLDPENEYAELAANLKGKFINVANASHGRINPFQIITSLEDDEAEEGQETSSYAAHLQFLEEFFRQILPETDGDALEYLNNLINRVYSRKNIDQYTNLNSLKPEDYPIFDDLYDCILEEFQRTKSDYLKTNLRVLMNYVAKFSTGGRNANIWNGPSTLSTAENFIVFNFQALLANRNNTVANAQMLLVLKYLDNEIIKNREYNLKYGASRKIIVVIDEAHVFIDVKYPLALDFMFQLAKRIRKYNGMQIVITQNIKDFVGSEELARKSTAIINACQYSLIFSLAPNDMQDLCTLYEKAGGINESEQEQIISAARGQAFVVTGPASRATVQIETPPAIVDLFSSPLYATHYFGGDEGAAAWEAVIGESREIRLDREAKEAEETVEAEERETLPDFRDSGVSIIELDEGEEEEELLLMGGDEPSASPSRQVQVQILEEEEAPAAAGPFSPAALQQYGFQALVEEIRRTVRQEVGREMGREASEEAPQPLFAGGGASSATAVRPEPVGVSEPAAPAQDIPDLFDFGQGAPEPFGFPESSAPEPSSEKDPFAGLFDGLESGSGGFDDWFTPPPGEALEVGAPTEELPPEPVVSNQENAPPAFAEEGASVEDGASAEDGGEGDELPLVYEVTLEQLMAMTD